MKIAVVTSFPPSQVALNEYGYQLVKNFVKKQEVAELVLITDKTKEPKQLDFDNSYKVQVKESWSFNSYFNFFRVIRTILNEKPEVVLFNLEFMKFGNKKIPVALGLLLPLFSKLFGFNTVVLLHDIFEEINTEKSHTVKNKLASKIYNFIGTSLTYCILEADMVVVTVSKYVEVLNEKYHCKNVIFIPYGLFEKPSRPNFDLPTGPKKVVASGVFGTNKKVEILIDAVELIRKTSKEAIEIVVAGIDSSSTPGYLESVKNKYMHVPGITFAGYVDENQLATIYNESVMIVFPYTSATRISGVLNHAGKYGKAVVMADLEELNLLVKGEGYKVEFYDPESSVSLAYAIGSILDDDNYRLELGKANYKAACALSMDKIVDMYLQGFNQIEYDKLERYLLSNM